MKTWVVILRGLVSRHVIVTALRLSLLSSQALAFAQAPHVQLRELLNIEVVRNRRLLRLVPQSGNFVLQLRDFAAGVHFIPPSRNFIRNCVMMIRGLVAGGAVTSLSPMEKVNRIGGASPAGRRASTCSRSWFNSVLGFIAASSPAAPGTCTSRLFAAGRGGAACPRTKLG